jgi:flavin reductase (DIM6/NTAB) family NADH-FMN oxidoreductase RutF
MKNKTSLKVGTLLMPVPVVMVSCGDESKDNIITIAWAGTVNSTPPMLSISVQRTRYSYELIKATKEFVVNIPDKNIVRETDLCGVISGRKEEKFHLTGLSRGKAEKVAAPIITECPINLECKVVQEIELNSHVMFIAEIVALHANKKLINQQNKLEIEKADLIAYAHGHYHRLGRDVGSFGFSVKK